MKSRILLVVLLISSIAYGQKKKNKILTDSGIQLPFEISGIADGLESGYVVFNALLDQEKKDTVLIQNGKFTYSGFIPETRTYQYLRHDGQSALFFLDSGKHDFIIDYKENKGFGITNAPSQESYNKFNQMLNPYFEARVQYQNQSGDSAQMYRNAIENNIQYLFNTFLGDTLSAPAVTAFLTLSNVEQTKGNANEAMETMWSKIPLKAQKSEMGIKARELLNLYTIDDIGKVPPDFTLKDVNGKDVKLSSFKGKNYVLVDFWATWCGPCRAEFPALMQAQNKYKDKGLVILGVSIDADQGKWKSFAQDASKTNWTHVWDGPPGPDQISTKLYFVPSIPRNFLVDKNTGKIIARNLRGAAVEQTLEKLIL
jgi:thiol-disulfide isomerase/thioredoxin